MMTVLYKRLRFQRAPNLASIHRMTLTNVRRAPGDYDGPVTWTPCCVCNRTEHRGIGSLLLCEMKACARTFHVGCFPETPGSSHNELFSPGAGADMADVSDAAAEAGDDEVLLRFPFGALVSEESLGLRFDGVGRSARMVATPSRSAPCGMSALCTMLAPSQMKCLWKVRCSVPAPVRLGLTCGPVRGLAAMQCQFPTMVKGDAVFAVISFYWHWHSSSGVCLPYCKCHWQQFSTCECPSGHCPEGLGLCQWHLYLGCKERFKGSYYVSLRREHAAGVPAFVWFVLTKTNNSHMIGIT